MNAPASSARATCGGLNAGNLSAAAGTGKLIIELNFLLDFHILGVSDVTAVLTR